MEENSLTPKQNKVPALVFLGMGAFEIGFVLIVLLLLFGTLNYFNILSISGVFPNQLGWLPRQQIKLASQGEALRGSNFTPNTFRYDTKKAEKLLTDYIKSTLKPELIPPKIEVKQGLTIDGRVGNTRHEFGSMFTLNNSSISANFHYKENINAPSDYFIFIQPQPLYSLLALASLFQILLLPFLYCRG